MGKTLKLTAALATAEADAKAARAAHKAEPTNRILRATYLGTLAVALASASALSKADPSTRAAMKKVTEKYSEKKERLEETDMEEEEESAESGASSSEASSAASSAKSSEEEEESVPPSTAKSSEEEEEEEGAAASEEGAASEEEEEEEEKAIAKGHKAAHASYLKATKGTDAYGVFGPKGMAKAILKATGQTTIKAALGALAAMPRKAKADAAVVADVAKLKGDATKAKIEAIVAEAKADGRANKAIRDEMRKIGASMGPTYLKGFAAKLPKIGRTTADGARRANAGDDGEAIGGPDAAGQEAVMKALTNGLDPKAAAEAVALFKDKQKAGRAATGRH